MELVGLDGKVLLSQPFEPIPGGSDAVVPQPASFSLLVPLPPGVVAARVVTSKTEIGSLKAKPSTPAVTLFSPKGGEAFRGPFQISWSGKDPDGDKVSYVVQYSNDDRQSWQVLALDYQAESFLQSTEHLPGGTQCRVRVLVSDGFRSTVVSSLPFAVETHAPFARIASPADPSRFVLGEQIRLTGFGYDVEDGSLGDQSLSWSIDGNPTSARGSELGLQDLLPGTHRIELRAMDSEGRVGTASTTVLVVRPTTSSGGSCSLICPPDLVKGCDSAKGTIIEFGVPRLVGDCGPDAVVQCDPPSGSLFPIGTTIVVCKARDAKGNFLVECKFTITVESSLSIGTAVCVRWTCGVLRSAPDLNGPWTDVPGATSPYYSTPGAPRLYYRVR